MSIYSWIKNKLSFSEGVTNWRYVVDRSRMTATGSYVDRQAALSLDGVYRGVDLISSAIGRCDCVTYRRGPNNGRTHAENHPAFGLLYRFSADNSPATNFVENIVSSALIHGNGFAFIEKDDAGNPTQLVNLDSEHVKIIVVQRENSLLPIVSYVAKGIGSNGSLVDVPLRSDQVIHLRGLGNGSGFSGFGLLDVARETVGLANEANKFASYYLQNSGVLHTIIEVPGVLKTDEQKADFLKQFEERHTGSSNAFKPAMVPAGTKIENLSVDVSKFGLEELSDRLNRQVANYLGLPPHILAVKGIGTSYGSINAENASVQGNVYDKWFCRLEGELTLKLMTEIEKRTGNVYVQFDRQSLYTIDPEAHENRLIKLFNANLISFEQCQIALEKTTDRVGTYFNDLQALLSKQSQPQPAAPAAQGIQDEQQQ